MAFTSRYVFHNRPFSWGSLGPAEARPSLVFILDVYKRQVFLDHTYAADGNDIGIDLHAHFSQEFTGDARSCNANSGLACARTLEDIATIGLIILEHRCV